MRFRDLDPRLATAIWIGLIYATIPFVRRVRELFVAHLPAEIIGYAVMGVVIVAAALAIRFLRRSSRRFGGRDVAWLVGVSAVFVIWTLRLMGQPEEAVHFLEYGALGILLYWALKARVPDRSIYLAVTLAGVLVGTVDEVIQWLVPDRFWDFRDIVLNGGAVVLSQIAVWRLAPRPSTPVRWSSGRLVCRLAAAEVLLLTMCLAATPQRLARIAAYVPLPDRLATGVDAICEYGFRHTVDDRTVFRSRLSLEELARSDLERAAEVAGELDAAKGKGAMARSAVSPVDDPFGYEVRVHLFSRNRNLQQARDTDLPAHRYHMTTAWRQNLILEHSYGTTLAKSSFQWGPRRRAEVENAQDPSEFFVSRAGEHLITRVSEGRLRTLMVALFAALVACDVLGASRSRRAAPPE